MFRRLLALALLVCAAPACTGADGIPEPSSSPLSPAALKVRVLKALGGQLVYCDPDVYPVPFHSHLENAHMQVPRVRREDPGTYRAIVDEEGLPPEGSLTDAQLLLVWSDIKQIGWIQLHREGEGYRFRIVVDYSGRAGRATEASGTVTRDGSVEVEHHATIRQSQLICPICLARGTRIATPNGPVRVKAVRIGTTVWSTTRSGNRTLAEVLRIGRTPVPPGHEVVRLRLADGRSVLISPGHPTADGRLVGRLRPGGFLDGSRVVSVVRIPYGDRFTYDLLPSGPTGTYFANGVLLASTLRERAPAIGRAHPLSST